MSYTESTVNVADTAYFNQYMREHKNFAYSVACIAPQLQYPQMARSITGLAEDYIIHLEK